MKTVMYAQVGILICLITRIYGLIDKNLPSFTQLPPLIQYYSPANPTVELQCRAWPPDAKVQFAITTKNTWMTRPNQNSALGSSNTQLTLMDHTRGKLLAPGHLSISDSIYLNELTDQNIHCLAGTEFGTVISRPFKIIKAGMSEFGDMPTNKGSTKEVSVLYGNVAIIDCNLPESHPPAQASFMFNNQLLTMSSNVTMVTWPEKKRVTLLISTITNENAGVYACRATNPITRETKTSPVTTRLTVVRATSSVEPKMVMAIHGSLRRGSKLMAVRAGSNLTLFCVMSGNPTPKVRTIRYEDRVSPDVLSRPRYFPNPKFASLTITNLQQSDAGMYTCTNEYMHSLMTLKVIEPLTIKRAPENVVLQNVPSVAAHFRCEASRPGSSVTWFFNGRPLMSNRDGSVTVPSVTSTNLGVYQCVAQDRQEWVSATATLSISSYNLLTRPPDFNPGFSRPSPFFSTSPGLIPPPNKVLREPLPIISSQNIDYNQEYLGRPTAHRLLDNLAVLVKWELIGDRLGPVKAFIVQSQEKCEDASMWSKERIIPQPTARTYKYVTSQDKSGLVLLRAQCQYRFRVFSQFQSRHSILSVWSEPSVSFMNVGPIQPKITRVFSDNANSVQIQWQYSDQNSWPVTTWRILYRPLTTTSGTRRTPSKLKLVPFTTMDLRLDGLEADTKYEIIVYGEHGQNSSRVTTMFSPVTQVSTLDGSQGHISTMPPSHPPRSSKSPFFSALWNSIKSNKVIYGGLLAVVAVLFLIMVLLCLLCFCRRRSRYRCKAGGSALNLGGATATNTTSAYKEVPGNDKESHHMVNGGTIPPRAGIMVGGSLDRRGLLGDGPPNMMTPQQQQMMMNRRAGSIQALETASMITDLYPSHPHQFSTLQQYPRSPAPPYQPPYQQMVAGGNSMRRAVPPPPPGAGVIDPETQSMSASQLYLFQDPQRAQHMAAYYQQQQQQQNRAVSPQLMMMMMNQQQQQQGPPLPSTHQFRRSTSSQLETPVALAHMPNSASVYGTGPGSYVGMMAPGGAPHHASGSMDDRVSVDGAAVARSLSPQQQYQMVDMYAAALAAQQQHPSGSMSRLHSNSSHGNNRHSNGYSIGRGQPLDPDYIGHNVGYAYHQHQQQQQQQQAQQSHTLNSLPEQGTIESTNSKSGGGASGGPPHHHRRKTRRQQQHQQGSNNNIPDQTSLDRSHMSGKQMEDMTTSDVATQDMLDNGGAALVTDLDNNQCLIDNLPRIRDVSEYGIPPMSSSHNHVPNNNMTTVANNNMVDSSKPVPPSKSHRNPGGAPMTTVANSYQQQQQQMGAADYYSSATSSDRSGPSPPPKYMHHSAAMQQGGPPPPPNDLYNMYYQQHHPSDTHC